MTHTQKIILILSIVVLVVSGGIAYFYTTYAPKPKAPDLGFKGLAVGQQNFIDDALDLPKTEFAFTQPTTTSTYIVGSSTEHLTATDQLARDIFTQYFANRTQTTISEEEANAFIEQYLQNVDFTLPQIQLSTTSDISLVTDSTETLTNYARRLLIILQTYLPQVSSVNQILYTATQKNDTTHLLEDLKEPITGYKSLITVLKTIPTPTSIAPFHITLINNLEYYHASLEMISRVEDDPISTMVAISIIYDQEQSIASSLEAIRQMLLVKGVDTTQLY